MLKKWCSSRYLNNIFSVWKRLIGDKEKAEERKGANNLNVVRWKMVSLPFVFMCSVTKCGSLVKDIFVLEMNF